jgi:hypothetical protein
MVEEDRKAMVEALRAMGQSKNVRVAWRAGSRTAIQLAVLSYAFDDSPRDVIETLIDAEYRQIASEFEELLSNDR